MKHKYRIYLDVCCLNRPLDDATQDRIRLEAEAVLLTYRKCRLKQWALISSGAIEAEVQQIPSPQKKAQVMLALSIALSVVKLNDEIKKRAIELTQYGLKPFDATHVACAEAGKADVMLTTDDRLIKAASRAEKALLVSVKNPVSWLLEIDE